MNEKKYDNLVRMRKDIQKDKDKVDALLKQIEGKEEKLKEAEAVRVVADVQAMGLIPEQVGAVLDLIASGQIKLVMNGNDAVKAINTKKTFEREDSNEDE